MSALFLVGLDLSPADVEYVDRAVKASGMDVREFVRAGVLMQADSVLERGAGEDVPSLQVRAMDAAREFAALPENCRMDLSRIERDDAVAGFVWLEMSTANAFYAWLAHSKPELFEEIRRGDYAGQ